ncbi:MAG: ABC transporter permease [Actinomycetota bacterium]
MLRIMLKGVRGHFVRFLLTTLSVMLGVAFIAGTQILTESLRATFDRIISGSTAGVDVVVRGVRINAGVENGGPDSVDLRQPVPLTEADSLNQVDGVRQAAPDIQGSAILVGRDGTAVRSGAAPSFGFAYLSDDPGLPVVAGRGPQSATEVAVESDTLERSGFQVGDRTRVVVAGGDEPREVKIVGEVQFIGGSAGQTIVLFDEATARKQFAPDGTVQQVSVRADAGVSQEQLRARVAAALPAGQEAITGDAYANEQRSELAEGLGFINTFLLVFAVVSVVVGIFIIFNTFSMLVAQRTRELALLRAVGATRRQVTGIVLGEALVIGLAGGLLGLVAGLGIARSLQTLFGFLGLRITGGLPLAASTVVTSMVVGVVVTLVSAFMPAIRAGRIAPVTAMRDDIALPERSLLLRGSLGLLVVAIGSAAMAGGVIQLDGSRAAQVLGIGAFITFLGLVIAAPLISRPVIRILGIPGARLSRVEGRLARDNTLRNPRRTSTTAISLMIGLTLVSAFSVLAATSKASVASLVNDEIRSDFVLFGGAAPFSNRIADQVAQLPAVDTVVDQTVIPLRIGETQTVGIATSGSGLQKAVDITVREGVLTAVDRGQLAIAETFADEENLRVGSQITATVGVQRQVRLVVGAVFADSQLIDAPVLLPRTYQDAVPAALRTSAFAFVIVNPETDLAEARRQITQVVKPQLVISVLDREEFTESISGQINQILGILYALLALSILIAALGILNTLALSVFERTREIGLLRAIGLTRRQLRRTIAQEAMLTALFGAVLGTALGLVLGVLLQRVLRDDGLDILAVPWVQIAVTFVGAAAVGLIASWWPARRAARLDVIRAISTE